MIKTNYYRKLPHIQPVGAKFFITFRLADTLPKSVIKEYAFQRDIKIKQLRNSRETDITSQITNERKRYFAKIDRILDSCKEGKTWLGNELIAKLVADKIHSLDKTYYELIAFCIMPNHAHLVVNTAIQLADVEIEEDSYTQVYSFMRLIKGATALEANKILNRTGKFWQRESYDHYIRDERELTNIIQYVIQNPVKAGLGKNWEDWKFTFVNNDYL